MSSLSKPLYQVSVWDSKLKFFSLREYYSNRKAADESLANAIAYYKDRYQTVSESNIPNVLSLDMSTTLLSTDDYNNRFNASLTKLAIYSKPSTFTW